MVVELNNAPTSLPEVLAKSGGLMRSVKAYNIKIIRGDMANPEVRIIDLSTLEGLRSADLIVQSNDIIYVEQKRTYAADLAQQISPIISPILSAIGLIVTLAVLSKTLK